MATAIVNIAKAAKQSNVIGLSESNEFDIVYAAVSGNNFGRSISSNETNNPALTDDTTAQSQSQNSTDNDLSPFKITDHSQENKQNDFTDEAPKNMAKRKYRKVFDSDSEKEDDFISSLLNKSNAEEFSGSLEPDMKRSNAPNLGKSLRRVIDSDSEGTDSVMTVKYSNYGDKGSCIEDKSEDNTTTKKTMKSRFRTLIDSETEDDTESKPSQNLHDENDEKASSDGNTTAKVKKTWKIISIVDSRSEDEVSSEDSIARSLPVKNNKVASDRNKKAKVDNKLVKSKISSVIDTDSEDDSTRNKVDRTSRDEQQKSGNLPSKMEKTAKKRTESLRTTKEDAMRQIHSETQRLIRSTEVSLPYHRPKQRSLQEFLNRKQFIPTLPEGLTTAAKVKMSSEIVGKVLEEKEKEAELFYKSSDSEDEVAISSIIANPGNDNEGSSSGTIVNHFNIEDTQKIFKNDVQNCHNKKEIIQQGAVDLGVPRKLFTKETEDLMENNSTETEHKYIEVSEFEDPRKKTKEIRHGLREVSVPRKLFGSDYDEAVAPSSSQDALAGASQSSEDVESNSETANSSRAENTIHTLVESDVAGIRSNLQNVSSDKNLTNIDASACNKFAEENVEFSNISDTPFISNKEFAKLNEKGKPSKQCVDSGEKLDEDEDSRESEVPVGHVMGLPPPDFESDVLRAEKLSNMKKKLLSTISNIGPRLRGAPGTFIDLSNDMKPNRKGVQSLFNRFIRHSAANKPAEVSSPVTVLHTEKTVDGLKVVEQILPYKLPTTDHFNDKELSKPGAKYLRLKNELIEKMAKKRGEEWKLKEQREKDENAEEDEEIEEIEDESSSEAETEPLDEEFQISSESEPEEDDMRPEKEKKRKPRDFADEEAEVSAEEDEEKMEISDENVDDEEQKVKERNRSEVIDEDDDTCDILSDDEDGTANKRIRPSRILKAFEDDSNSLPETSLPNESNSRDKVFERTKTDIDMFAPEDGNDGWLSDVEAELPPSQIPPRDQADARSQLCKTPLTAVNILRFVSPITQLTALNSCTDSPKDGFALKGTPGPNLRIVELSVEKTPLEKKTPISYDSEKRNSFQKKLFEDPAGMVNDEELMDLCSGKFTAMESDDEGIESYNKVSESQVLGLGLSLFSSQALDSENIVKATVSVVDEASQDIRLTFDGNSEDSCDKHIGKESTTKSKVPWVTFKVTSSSDEENFLENESEGKDRRKNREKKKVKKLELSDDEDEESMSSQEEEEFDILDNDNEDKYVDYDSEENEVVIVPKKDIKKVAAGFLDEEAELSESEWGSADEDEKDLDKLEIEEGDDEEIDENQMRDQLGKMHMRQVLDDDQREVRMLQELLFDDGDLHTEDGGRERQFKWKNIDNLGDDDKLGPRTNDLDENGDLIEEDNDIEWRKQRLERDKFIEDKMKCSIDIVCDELESDSQIFKLGMKALKKSKSIHNLQMEPDVTFAKKPLVPRTVLDLLGCPNTGQSSRMLNKAVKRGSFLARGDECLARLAIQIKHSETTITTRKNPRNFVFTHISPSVAGTADKEQKDESAMSENSLTNPKTKKRKPSASVTPRTAKKAKIEVTRSTGKKLFKE